MVKVEGNIPRSQWTTPLLVRLGPTSAARNNPDQADYVDEYGPEGTIDGYS